MRDKFEIPLTGKPRNIKLTEHKEYEFENGLKLFVLYDDKFPLVTARFVFKSGSAYDNKRIEGKDGLSSITSELLLKGTHSTDSRQIAERADYYGSILVSGSNHDASYLTFHTLDKYFGEMYRLTEEILSDPVFPEEELNNLKKIRINSLLSSYDSGDYIAHKIFNKKLGHNSEYSHQPEGCINSVESINREDVQYFYSEFFNPSNMIIALVGNIIPEKASELIESSFRLNKKDIAEVNLAAEYKNPSKTEVYLINRPGAVQSDICLGNAGIQRNSKDFISSSLLNTIFGGYFSSRVNRNLREINGFTYGARSVLECKKYSGEFITETSVNTENTKSAIKEIIKEMELIRTVNVSEEEIENAKNYIIGNFPLQFETSNAIATKLINMELYDIERNFYEHYLTDMHELKRADVTETANKYFKPENLIIAIAGDTEKIIRNFNGEFSVKQITDADLIK
jgi:predicted Zn-dependent peptidase